MTDNLYPLHCEKCGEFMLTEDGENIQGFKIRTHIDGTQDVKIRDYVKKRGWEYIGAGGYLCVEDKIYKRDKNNQWILKEEK